MQIYINSETTILVNTLVGPGGGALANLARPGGRAFANPGDNSEKFVDVFKGMFS